MSNKTLAARYANSCAMLDDKDFQELKSIALSYIESKKGLITILNSIGMPIEKAMGMLPNNIRESILDATRSVLENLYNFSSIGLENDPGRDAQDFTYQISAFFSGIVGGAGGLATTLLELPITNGIIFRSIADKARATGFDLEDEEVKRTCIEVFSFGGPTDDDDDADLAFVATRLVQQDLMAVILAVATRYIPVIATKYGAQAMPVVGAAVGGGLNLLFINFFQSMAEVRFRLLGIERKYDAEQVRSCFQAIVKELREMNRARGR